MFVIKTGRFYFAGYDEELDEELYSSGTHSALKFETLEEADHAIDKLHLIGYVTPMKD